MTATARASAAGPMTATAPLVAEILALRPIPGG
ncbi:hypothetical protein JOF40_002556 [Aeromicrobium fastidiosum]|nr:hypothetical protein [Aeromicrobium fastidiosum]